jgi:hypothetical protein
MRERDWSLICKGKPDNSGVSGERLSAIGAPDRLKSAIGSGGILPGLTAKKAVDSKPPQAGSPKLKLQS